MGSIANEGAKRLNTRNLTTQVAEICKDLGAPSPGEFLAYVSAGVDPRTVNTLYQYLNTLKRKRDELTDPQWEKVFELLDETPCSFEPIDLTTSLAAVMKLMEFLHAKQKAVEVSGVVGAAVGTIEKMDKKGIKAMKEIFDKEF